MLTIRLYPTGRKHKRTYRVVLANKRHHVTKQYIENLGIYNPFTKVTVLNEERVKYWLAQNIEVSERVSKILESNKLIPTTTKVYPVKSEVTDPKKSKKTKKTK
jgi:ribosomal protein S16